MTTTLQPKDKLDAETMVAVNGPEGDFLGWQSVDWREAEDRVRRLRQRIFTASREGDLGRVRNLQKLMLRSRSNALVSVRRVTEVNVGRKTAGIDGMVARFASDKAMLVDLVQHRAASWMPRPVRRAFIPKAGNTRKLRPLGIPVLADRALQSVVVNALEPEWEARFESRSYGFRPGRGCHDAIEAIYATGKGKRSKRVWILDADLAAAFDRINHEHLLDQLAGFPAREQIRRWLKAGVVDQGRFALTEEGTPQGGLCSAEHNEPNEQCWVMRSVDLSGLLRVGCGGRALCIMRCGFWSRFDHGAGPRRIGATDKLLEWNQNLVWFADLELHDRDGYAQPSALGSALHQATGPTLRITQHCSLGGPISPLLLNVALHGMEAAAGVRYLAGTHVGHTAPGSPVVVRYADDLIAMCHSREQAEQVKARLADWLMPRGLTFNEDKTRVVHLTEGFDFLGVNIRRYPNGKLIVKPSKAAVKRFRHRLRTEMRDLRGSNAIAVITRLNPILRGWAAYYRSVVSKHDFTSIDSYLWWLTFKWAVRGHRNKSKKWVVARYYGRFNQARQDKWVFGDRETGAYLTKTAWTPIVRHQMVDGFASMDDPDRSRYWAMRKRRRRPPIDRWGLIQLERQNGRCPLCQGLLLHTDHEPQSPDEWEIWITVVRQAIRRQAITADQQPAYPNGPNASRLVHTHCARQVARRNERRATSRDPSGLA